MAQAGRAARTEDVPAEAIEAVRRFNRFYTRRIGLLEECQLGSDFTLAEMRVLYELANRPSSSAARIGRDLGLDPGYLSRILATFARRGLVAREADPEDGRARILRLTAAGREAFAPVDRGSQAMVARLLEPLGAAERDGLVCAMRRIAAALGESPAAVAEPGAVTLRGHAPGDLGWIVARHGALYAREQGWGAPFEALVAQVAARFLSAFDPERERAFIAERDGIRLGCVLLVRGDDPETAKLRLLLVEPSARGLGLGRRLVAECTAFAREAGYARIVLWTHECLTAARRLYAEAGYTLAGSVPHRSFGAEVVGETWERALG